MYDIAICDDSAQDRSTLKEVLRMLMLVEEQMK